MTNIKVKFNIKTGGYTCYMMVDGEPTKTEEWKTKRDAMASARQYAELIGLDPTCFVEAHDEQKAEDEYAAIYNELMQYGEHYLRKLV